MRCSTQGSTGAMPAPEATTTIRSHMRVVYMKPAQEGAQASAHHPRARGAVSSRLHADIRSSQRCVLVIWMQAARASDDMACKAASLPLPHLVPGSAAHTPAWREAAPSVPPPPRELSSSRQPAR